MALSNKIKYGPYLKNEQGITRYAEASMDKLVRKVTQKESSYRESNENLLVEKANLRLRAEELHDKPSLDPAEYFSVRKKIFTDTFITLMVVLAMLFLSYVAAASFVAEETSGAGLLRWLIALVMTMVFAGGGLIVAQRLIESVLPVESYDGRRSPVARQAEVILWGFLLVGIEIGLIGVAQVTASALTDGGLLYLGLIVLASILPILAGAARWHMLRFLDAYKNTQLLRTVDERIAQIDSTLRQSEEADNTNFKLTLTQYWDMLNDFITEKQNYNRQKGLKEEVGDHFARSYEAFQREAYDRYQADLRDSTTRAVRTLDTAPQAAAGGKLASQPERPAPRPAAATEG